jgi:hypothetical protein
MRTIGIRVSPKVVTFAIFDTEENAIVNIENIKIPAALSAPRQLRHVRTSTLDVIKEYGVRFAGIRTTEPKAKSRSAFRFHVEGVIQEAFVGTDIEGYETGPSATMASLLKIKHTALMEQIRGESRPDWADKWAELTTEAREAALIAVGVANVNNKI